MTEQREKVRQQAETRRALIQELIVRDGHHCYLCVDDFTDDDPLTIEHVLPLSRGGTWDMPNLKLAHKSCNQRKADRVFLDDGTLEPRKRTMGYRARKNNREKIIDAFCELCYDGRLLLENEACPECTRGAVPWPWTYKLDPKQCSHSGPWWCLTGGGFKISNPNAHSSCGCGKSFEA